MSLYGNGAKLNFLIWEGGFFEGRAPLPLKIYISISKKSRTFFAIFKNFRFPYTKKRFAILG